MLPFLPLLPIFLPDLCFPPLPPQLYELDSFCVDPRRIQEGRKPPVLLHVLSCCQPSPSPLSGTAAHCSALPSWNCCTVCTLELLHSVHPGTAAHWHTGTPAHCSCTVCQTAIVELLHSVHTVELLHTGTGLVAPAVTRPIALLALQLPVVMGRGEGSAVAAADARSVSSG